MKLLQTLAALVIALSTAACTMAPVYQSAAQGSSPSSQTTLAFQWAEPRDRYQQIIIQNLRTAFFRGGDETTPLVTITAVPSGRVLSLASQAIADGQDGRTPHEATMTATAVVTLQGKEIYRAARTASAGFTTGDQAFSNQEAIVEAYERAARSVAESLRLALFAQFHRSQFSGLQ